MGESMANERLREAILNAGLTPYELADKLGVNPKTVERWVTPGFRIRVTDTPSRLCLRSGRRTCGRTR